MTSADSGERARLWRPVRWTAIAGWALLLGVWIWTRGVPFDRLGVLIWIATGLFAASIGRRALWAVLLDWTPFALVLIAYDFARGASENLNGHTLWTPQIDADRWLFGGNVPTVWLQEQLKDATPRWWDAVVSLTYISFFLLPYLLAGVFWLRSRSEFYRWAARYVTMSFLAVGMFLAIPSAPPWAAARCTAAQVSDHPSYPICMALSPVLAPGGGLLGRFTPVHAGAGGYVERISGRGFGQLHISVAATVLDEGQDTVDLVAAVPSLHAGVTLLAVLFLWRRLRIWWRVLGVAYVLTMAFALVYSAEHYVFDILAGWALAVLVMAVFGRFDKWRAKRAQPADCADDRRAERDGYAGSSDPNAIPLENQCPPTETMPSSTSVSDAVSSTPPARSTAAADPPGTTARSASS